MLWQIILIVSLTGTLVKRDSASNEVRMPAGCMERSNDRKSPVELIWYCARINGVCNDYVYLFGCFYIHTHISYMYNVLTKMAKSW